MSSKASSSRLAASTQVVEIHPFAFPVPGSRYLVTLNLLVTQAVVEVSYGIIGDQITSLPGAIICSNGRDTAGSRF